MADFFTALGKEALLRTHEHIFLTTITMLLACAVAIPTAVYLSRNGRGKLVALVMGAANLVQPIPSLALVAFVVALFSLCGLPTIGTQPALVALVAYALLPILRNTYAGIGQVDPTLIDVAEGLGMTRNQILFRVQIPLALPVIMAGIRISTVWTIGVATLVSLVGAGGLGDLIFKGLRTYQMDLVLAGAIPAALLALIFDWILSSLERWLSPGGFRDQKAMTDS
jgi:osmoprotectant transport system permease protein